MINRDFGCHPIFCQAWALDLVMPMEIIFMDMEDKHLKYGTLRSLRYIHSNPFRFPISSLSLPIFFLRIAERQRWWNMPPRTTHWSDIIVTHKIFLITSSYCFLTTFQQPICSSTGAFATIIIVLCWGDIPAWSSRYAIKTHAWSKPRQIKIMTMSDLIKTQSTPQFNRYNSWMSLGANGTPDNLIKEGLKQPHRIKISFKKVAKEITGHVAPDQAWFGTEYFLAYMLPKDDGPLLFNLIGQCFQDVGLTKWTSVIAKQCPDNADHTKVNFDECIRDYLEAISGLPNVGNQMICWHCTAKKPALMPMHKFMPCQEPPRIKKQPREKKTAHLPAARSHESSYQQHQCHKYCNYHQSNQCNCNNHQSDHRHQDNWCHNCPRCDNKDSKSRKSYEKKDDCKHDHFKKKSNEAMHNDQSTLLCMGNLSGKRSHSCSRSSLCSHSWSCSCSSSRSYDNHHVDNDDCKPSMLLKHGYLCSSKIDDGGRIHCPDKSNTLFPTFSAPMAKRGKRTPK
jgi:hypothetical protein